jgi:mannose-1-phosphate guanylyltransferase
MHAGLKRIQECAKQGRTEEITRIYGELEIRSFDYAITEQLNPHDVIIIRAPFDWSDVGLWGALKQLREENSNDNVVEGADHVSLETSNCFIYGPHKKVIATIGIDDCIIIDTEDALLICRNNKDQDIKRIVDEMRQTGREHYL